MYLSLQLCQETYFWMLLLAFCKIHSVLPDAVETYTFSLSADCVSRAAFSKEKCRRFIFCWWLVETLIGSWRRRNEHEAWLRWRCGSVTAGLVFIIRACWAVASLWNGLERQLLTPGVHSIWTARVAQQRGPRGEEASSSFLSLRCLCSQEGRESRGDAPWHGQQEHMCTFLATAAATEQSLTMLPN